MVGRGPRGYFRVEAVLPSPSGRHPGVFALLRGLGESGDMSPGDALTAAELVRRSYALHREPASECFRTDPPALSWFRDADTAAIERLRVLTREVAEVLRRYGIETRSVTTEDPGRLTYADDVQVVAVPRSRARGT